MSRIIRPLAVFLAILMLLAPTVIFAFNGSYSPTAHSQSVAELSSYSCAGNSRLGSPQSAVVRVMTTMSWNTTNAQNARNYAGNGEYYTHDITEMNDNLDGWCLWTNFSSPHYDWDDDGGTWSKWEESEVIAVSASFPPANTNYSVNSYFTRWHLEYAGSTSPFWVRDGDSGSISITPATSSYTWWSGEYDTTHYDGQPVILNYGSSLLSSNLMTPAQQSDPDRQATDIATIALGKNNTYTARIVKEGSRVFVKALNAPVATAAERAEYAAWARGLAPELRQAGVRKARVSITFNRHITPRDFERLAAEYQLDLNALHVEYAAVNEQGAPEVWTGFIRNRHGIDIAVLDKAAQEQAAVDLTQPHGIVSVDGTMTVALVERLNRDNRVFLADPSASYIALVAPRHPAVQAALADALAQKKVEVRQQAEIAAREGNQQAQALMAAPNVDRAISDFINQHPEMIPQVEVKVRDFWHLIKQ